MPTAYENLTDEDLVELIHTGDSSAQEYLIDKYKSVVKLRCRAYFIKGADKEDIIQEGMIGLYKAIRDFQKDKLSSFYSFANLCVTRQIITAIKAATRQKHIPMTSYVSLSKLISEDDSDKTWLDLMTDEHSLSPEELFIDQEERRHIETSLTKTLSDLECRVLSLHLQGRSYFEIGSIMNKDEKAIDNALQRVRKKLEKIISAKNLTVSKKYVRI